MEDGYVAASVGGRVRVEEASILMDRPPGGWSDLVTNQTLDLKIDALRSDLRAEMAELRVEMSQLTRRSAAASSDVDDDDDDDRRRSGSR